MSKPVVLGLLGRAGSGKSTAANYLIKTFGAKKYSHAAPLKLMAKDLFEFSDDQLYGTQAQKEAVDERYGFSARTAMERLGKSGRDRLGLSIWRDACINSILLDSGNSFGIYVIDDVRYLNEIERIATAKDVIGRVIRLKCPDTEASELFPSEKEMDLAPPEHIAHTIVSHKSPGSVDLLDKIRQAIYLSVFDDSTVLKLMDREREFGGPR